MFLDFGFRSVYVVGLSINPRDASVPAGMYFSLRLSHGLFLFFSTP